MEKKLTIKEIEESKLRDQFAGLAMQGFIASVRGINAEHYSELSYGVANAMLKARKEVKS